MPNNNTDYWIQRSERRILNAEKTAQEMLKDLKKLYQQTIDRINKEIEAFYGRYASETGLSIADVKKLLTANELKQFRREVEEYYKELSKYPYDPTYRERLKNAIYTTTTKDGRKLYSLRRNVSRLDYIKMQMENAIETLYARENETFTTNLSKTYEDTYMRSVFDTQQATGVFQPFNALNSLIIQKTVQQKWLGDNYSDRIWSDKNKLIDTLETTFSQGVVLGRNPRVIARDISKATGVKYSNCERLARTEFNHIANEATREGYTQTDGLDRYMFVATLDSRTSAICQSLSGKVFLVSEAEVGVNYPSMHPNCRSTTIPYLEDMDLSKMEQIATIGNKSYYVPAGLSYSEWLNSLTEEQGKMYYSERKARQQYSSDKKQLAEYRKLATQAKKQGQESLFEGLPTRLADFQRLKHLEPEKYQIYVDNSKITRSLTKD